MATENQLRLQEILDKFVAEPGVVGAALVTRDGLLLLQRGSRLSSPETFSAMTAALAAAAETALSEAGFEGATKIEVTVPKARNITVGAGGETLLSILFAPDIPAADAHARADRVASTVRSVLGG